MEANRPAIASIALAHAPTLAADEDDGFADLASHAKNHGAAHAAVAADGATAGSGFANFASGPDPLQLALADKAELVKCAPLRAFFPWRASAYASAPNHACIARVAATRCRASECTATMRLYALPPYRLNWGNAGNNHEPVRFARLGTGWRMRSEVRELEMQLVMAKVTIAELSAENSKLRHALALKGVKWDS